ncbi:zinc transport system ATP-binding protein [Butyrivibrio fibrisolvens]|uniref:Zinc transport system ATP-binding protein n=1 Tax=Butyrivibrio fibrisolvens TaxID=831 RepID=A0A1H9S1T6_BUTFI|nr:zinc transport system ATP-binding protein [Butyrivibrio fibrisolvens]
MALLKVQNLSLGYDSHAIVENLNFTVNTGDYLCIVGENGSGKSTLMKTLLHLQEPISGQILTGDGLKKNEIGYLPQQTIVQKDFPASVREIVLSGCQGRSLLRPFYSKEDKKLARINMERMEILDLEKRCYRELSGGQQQRVLLARALCATRKVLLLDEPVSGLDPKVTAQMYELIQKLNKDGITIIMISHDIAAAVSYASHILHIGDDIFFGTRDEYKESEVGKLFLMQNKIALNTTNTINATNTINNTNTIKTIEAPGSNTVSSLGQGQGGLA